MTIKSITAKVIFRLHPEVKTKLLGGNFWTSGYYINAVGQYGNENVIQKYIQNQGEEKTVYKSFNKNQLRLYSEWNDTSNLCLRVIHSDYYYEP